jgi:hypothetical protein
MKYHFTKHFNETLKKRYGIKLTKDIKDKLIHNINDAKYYKRDLKGRAPGKLVFIGDSLYDHIAVAYDAKTLTFVTALSIGYK